MATPADAPAVTVRPRKVKLKPSMACSSDAALARLAVIDAREGQIVELRFFGGLTMEETAEVLSISPRTVRREWMLAKAWLRGEIAQA